MPLWPRTHRAGARERAGLLAGLSRRSAVVPAVGAPEPQLRLPRYVPLHRQRDAARATSCRPRGSAKHQPQLLLAQIRPRSFRKRHLAPILARLVYRRHRVAVHPIDEPGHRACDADPPARRQPRSKRLPHPPPLLLLVGQIRVCTQKRCHFAGPGSPDHSYRCQTRRSSRCRCTNQRS